VITRFTRSFCLPPLVFTTLYRSLGGTGLAAPLASRCWHMPRGTADVRPALGLADMG
jgi:hypothetical protein